MVSKALSHQVRRQKKAHADQRRLQEAAVAYREAEEHGEKLSIRQVALDFSVPKSSLQHFLNGNNRTMLEFNTSKQRLTASEEKVLADFIVESAEHGFAPTHNEIKKYANAILQSCLRTQCQLLSKTWIFRFLTRHHDRLQTFWSKPLDTQCAKSLNPAAVNSFYDIIEKFIINLGIPPELIFRMDESGFLMAYSGKEHVVGACGTKTQHKQGGADQQNVTVLVTICADGMTIPLMIIFKGKNFMQKWNEDNVTNA